ncbi:hypothetical protein NQZ68_034882 [Dissostichus eleginoides]|nr:hypothetical protein NQZ68_034882 [Dissostichus eleginoides]
MFVPVTLVLRREDGQLLAHGRKGEVRVLCMPSCVHMEANTRDSKFLPWSLCKDFGTPNRLNMPATKASATVTAS